MRFSFFSPYFGQTLPSLTPFILRSWGLNRPVTFFIHTNLAAEFAAIGTGIYENIRIIETTQSQFVNTLQGRLAIDLKRFLLWDSWHLCRLRPAFGEAFADLLDGIDFWGYIDLDVLVADLIPFLSAERFRDIDIDFFHRFGSGTMVALRNTLIVNRAWRGVPYYIDWLNRQKQFPAFDDDGGGFTVFARRDTTLRTRRYEAAIDSLKIDFRWRKWSPLAWDESLRNVRYNGKTIVTVADQRSRAAVVLDFLQKWSRHHTFVSPAFPVTFHGYPDEMFEQSDWLRAPSAVATFLSPAASI